MLRLPSGRWNCSYLRKAILAVFCNPELMATKRKEFLEIMSNEGETVVEFLEWFYNMAQHVQGPGHMGKFDPRIALSHALKNHRDLNMVLLPALIDN